MPYGWWYDILKVQDSLDKIENLKNIELNTLPVCNDRYKKTKVKTNGHKVYINFRALNVPEHSAECESFTIISIRFNYENKYYLASIFKKFADKQNINYLVWKYIYVIVLIAL